MDHLHFWFHRKAQRCSGNAPQRGAFVDAEAEMFLPNDPLNTEDRVLAGLSVAFDASCEEMWIAWRNGACLVPAPRALVRSGVGLMADFSRYHRGFHGADVGEYMARRSPRCRAAADFRWRSLPTRVGCPASNGYPRAVEHLRPTEATVVACGTTMDGVKPVSIGLPLRGWDLAVVNADGNPVEMGEVGELIIGGVASPATLTQRRMPKSSPQCPH